MGQALGNMRDSMLATCLPFSLPSPPASCSNYNKAKQCTGHISRWRPWAANPGLRMLLAPPPNAEAGDRQEACAGELASKASKGMSGAVASKGRPIAAYCPATCSLGAHARKSRQQRTERQDKIKEKTMMMMRRRSQHAPLQAAARGWGPLALRCGGGEAGPARNGRNCHARRRPQLSAVQIQSQDATVPTQHDIPCITCRPTCRDERESLGGRERERERARD